MERDEILLLHGTEYQEMTVRLLREAKLAEHLPRKEMRIGIKPNLVVAATASTGATTHPEIVAGVIEYLQENGYTNLCVLEGSWVGARTDRAFQVSGIGDVCRRYGVECIDLQKDSYEKVNAAGMPMEICKQALALDFLINLPVLKGHCQTIVTCALKNHKGLLCNNEKRHFHALGLHRPIAHLATVFAPKEFILVDNICGDLDFEEGGNPVRMDRLLCGFDPVLIDTFAVETMGYGIEEIPYVGMAEQLGAGTTALNPEKIKALNAPVVTAAPRPTRRVKELEEYVKADNACSACYGSLIYALDKLDQRNELWGHREKVCIGQGFRGKSGDIGVGRCTGCFERNVGGCPPTAAQMLAFLEEEWR